MADFTLAELANAIDAAKAVPEVPYARGLVLTPAQAAEGRRLGVVRDASEGERAEFPDCDAWMTANGGAPVYTTRWIERPQPGPLGG